MKHIFETLKVLIFTLFGIALTFIVYQALNRLTVKDNRQTYLVYATFDDLKQLQIGDDVRLAGVRIGSVTDASLRGNLAVATLSIDKKFSVPSDSVATISMAGLLGANYIAILPGNNPHPLQPNEKLKTQNPIDVGAMLQKFGSVGERLDRILANFDGEDIGDNLFGGLRDIGDFFKNNREKFSKIIDNCSEITQNVNTITQHVAEGQGTLGKLIYDEHAYKQFNEMIQSLSDIAKDVQGGRGLVGKLLYDPKTSQSFDTLMENSNTMMKNLKEFSARLNNEHSTLGRIISDDSLYKKAEAALDKVDGAVNSVSNSGPVTAVGAAASALF